MNEPSKLKNQGGVLTFLYIQLPFFSLQNSHEICFCDCSEEETKKSFCLQLTNLLLKQNDAKTNKSAILSFVGSNFTTNMSVSRFLQIGIFLVVKLNTTHCRMYDVIYGIP
jgi:hypothetical protein